MSDADLERLTITELESLRQRVEDEVRSRLRAKRLARANVVTPPPQSAQVDLEAERDKWLRTRA